VNNAATSKFSLDEAFGNRRPNSKSLYNGGLAAIFDNSALDARPYALSGVEAPKPFYNRITGAFTFGGPIKIPHLLPHGPIFFVAYQWTRDRIAQTQSGLVPTAAERPGDLAGLLNPIFNPATGLSFAGNIVPVSPQAQALLKLYPLPNITGSHDSGVRQQFDPVGTHLR
jgi:trimeric autotransporter adhesin